MDTIKINKKDFFSLIYRSLESLSNSYSKCDFRNRSNIRNKIIVTIKYYLLINSNTNKELNNLYDNFKKEYLDKILAKIKNKIAMEKHCIQAKLKFFTDIKSILESNVNISIKRDNQKFLKIKSVGSRAISYLKNYCKEIKSSENINPMNSPNYVSNPKSSLSIYKTEQRMILIPNKKKEKTINLITSINTKQSNMTNQEQKIGKVITFKKDLNIQNTKIDKVKINNKQNKNISIKRKGKIQNNQTNNNILNTNITNKYCKSINNSDSSKSKQNNQPYNVNKLSKENEILQLNIESLHSDQEKSRQTLNQINQKLLEIFNSRNTRVNQIDQNSKNIVNLTNKIFHNITTNSNNNNNQNNSIDNGNRCSVTKYKKKYPQNTNREKLDTINEENEENYKETVAFNTVKLDNHKKTLNNSITTPIKEYNKTMVYNKNPNNNNLINYSLVERKINSKSMQSIQLSSSQNFYDQFSNTDQNINNNSIMDNSNINHNNSTIKLDINNSSENNYNNIDNDESTINPMLKSLFLKDENKETNGEYVCKNSFNSTIEEKEENNNESLLPFSI